jgi:hypothetical protein
MLVNTFLRQPGIGQSGLKFSHPGGCRPPPQRIRRHDIASASRDPSLLQAVGDAGRELGEVAVGLVRRAVRGIEDQRMVLVGSQRLLVPRLAPKREPGPGSRRFTKVPQNQGDQLSGRCIDGGRDDVANLDGVRFRIDQRHDDLWEP